MQRRRFLADTDVARGQLPLAALSAEAEMLRARAAVVAGDLDLARRCLAQASAHALGDRDVTVAVDKLRRELPQ